MSRRALERDEHHGFGRPQRRTKPRTKDRPDYSDAEVGLVITVDRGRYSVDLDNEHGHRRVLAAKARQLGRKGVIVGDRARVVGDTSGAEGTLARIVEVTERETVLRRTADDNDPFERPIVANADQLAIVTALADPPPRMGMIDRILVASYDAGLEPLLVLTKADLAPPDELLAAYAGLDVEAIVVEPGSGKALTWSATSCRWWSSTSCPSRRRTIRWFARAAARSKPAAAIHSANSPCRRPRWRSSRAQGA